MSRPLFLFGLLGLVAGLFCRKVETQPQPTLTSTESPAPSGPYTLSTPDEAAFSVLWPLDSGKTEYGHPYNGSAFALRDSTNRTSSATLAIYPDEQPLVVSLTMRIFNKLGQVSSTIGVSLPSKKAGVYLPNQHGVSFTYHDTEDNCGLFNWYVPDTNQLSFFRLVSYDSQKKELKGRFKFHFVKVYDNEPSKHFPDTIFFDDGAVIARRVN